mmetsp:Transcript_53805/g.117724  ORF Transcript_53805/g.117724 Transcript_53805/m.117724 type:complete len:225 (+) Transcript_53805:65-739(+)
MGQQNCGCGPCDKDENETTGKVDDVGRSGYALDKAAEETIFEPPNAPIGLRKGCSPKADPGLVDSIDASVKDAKKAVPKAWRKLRGEFGVQVNIWGSLAIGSRGQGDTKKKEREIAKKGIDAALAQFETNPSEALHKLEEVLAGSGAAALNNATVAAAKHIQMKSKHAARREELSNLLSQKDAAVKMAPLHLEQLIEDCCFENANLEARVRAVLELVDSGREGT